MEDKFKEFFKNYLYYSDLKNNNKKKEKKEKREKKRRRQNTCVACM